jgi:hypothetical protein
VDLVGEVGEEDPDEDREVLRPLMRAQRVQERWDRGSSRRGGGAAGRRGPDGRPKGRG